ncbi:MAG: class I adenylate-forming enzyme family protein [Acidimicrobiia bacterium]
MDHIDRWNILEPDAVAVELPGRSVSYRELSTLVSRGSGALAGYGVRPGDRVPVWVRNDLPSLVALWAIPRMGGVAVPISSRLAHPQVMVQLDMADPALILGADALTGRTTHATESLFEGRPAVPHPHSPDELHSVFFTSGSEGDPKGVRLTWGNHEASAAASFGSQAVSPDDRWLAVLPLFHLGGFAITYRMFRAGGTVVLEPEFEPSRIAAMLDDVSYASLVPSMISPLLAELPDGFGGRLKSILVGGAALGSSLHESARAAGLPVAPTYGMTETASQIATAGPGDRPGTGAPLLEGVEVQAGSAEQPAAVRVSGPMVSPGYLGEEDRVGPFGTGDAGFLDEAGRLHIVGRADEMIITGGENVHPVEIEMALEDHPSVQAAAVFGVADDTWGQRIEAAVVLADPAATSDSIESDLRATLADFRIPKGWHLLTELPMGPTGKVDRQAVRALLREPGTEKEESRG